MQYRLRTLLVLLSTGLPGLAVYAQKAPITDAQKGRMTTYYEQDEDVKQRYAAAKAELARIERAIGPRAESRDSK